MKALTAFLEPPPLTDAAYSTWENEAKSISTAAEIVELSP